MKWHKYVTFETGLLLLHSLKKRSKNDARGPDRVEIYRKNVTGIELAAKHQRTLERAGSYLNSNRRHIVSDRSLFRSVDRLATDAGRYISQ